MSVVFKFHPPSALLIHVHSGAAIHFMRELPGNCQKNPRNAKTKKPAAGGGAAGFQYRSSDWEEECRYSCKQPWEEEWAASHIEGQREEVHPFDKYDYI
jgi:hypothetical protein